MKLDYNHVIQIISQLKDELSDIEIAQLLAGHYTLITNPNNRLKKTINFN